MTTPAALQHIEQAILLIRGQKVLLDENLAELYGVPVKRLNEAVRRNKDRFPKDFMFQLTAKELKELRLLRSQSVTAKELQNLRSQIATSSWGGRRTPPYAFTEQGVAMLSSVLRSPRAIRVNIEIMRAFVRLRQMLASHKGLARKLEALEKKFDAKFRVVFEAIHQLMTPPETKRGRIGFHGQPKETQPKKGSSRRKKG